MQKKLINDRKILTKSNFVTIQQHKHPINKIITKLMKFQQKTKNYFDKIIKIDVKELFTQQ